MNKSKVKNDPSDSFTSQGDAESPDSITSQTEAGQLEETNPLEETSSKP